MTENIFDHDRLDVYRLAIDYTAVDYDYEHRFAEHEHEGEPEQ